MALKVLQAYSGKLLKNIPVQNAIKMSCITSEFPVLVVVVARQLVTTTQLYSNELFPSATFIHRCQNLAFTVCPHGKRASSLVAAESQNDLGRRLIRMGFFIWEWRDKTIAHFHTSRHTGVSRITQNNNGEHRICRWNYEGWVQKRRHLV